MQKIIISLPGTPAKVKILIEKSVGNSSRVKDGCSITDLPSNQALDSVAMSMTPEDCKKRTFFILIMQKAEPGQAAIQLFIGTPKKIQEMTVTSFERLRDGGTTMIQYKLPSNDGCQGILFFPSPLKDPRTNWPSNHCSIPSFYNGRLIRLTLK